MPHHAAFRVPLNKLDVAVVDDITHMTDLLRLMLSAVEVGRIRTYNGAMQFLEACRHDPPHLLLTDLSMRPMNGYQLIQLARREYMDPFCLMAIVAVSAHATQKNIEKILLSGANDFMVKPISVNALRARLRRITNNPRELILERGVFVVEGMGEVLQSGRGQALAGDAAIAGEARWV